MIVFPRGSKPAVSPAPIVILRLADKMNEPSACSVLLPAKVTLVEGDEGTAPKAASLPIARIPWLSVVPPENVLLPVKA